jgi:hypothetical protein
MNNFDARKLNQQTQYELRKQVVRLRKKVWTTKPYPKSSVFANPTSVRFGKSLNGRSSGDSEVPSEVPGTVYLTPIFFPEIQKQKPPVSLDAKRFLYFIQIFCPKSQASLRELKRKIKRH